MLVLAPVVSAAGQPPGAAGGGLTTRRSPAARPGSLRSAGSRTLPCGAGPAGGVRADSARAGSGPGRAESAAPSPRTRRGPRGAPSPRSCDVPRLGVPAHAGGPALLRTLAPASARDPSPAHPHGPWPASGARSARACRSTGRTSWSTCPPRCGSPRGPRRAQPALRGLLPHPQLDRGLTQRLGQVDDLGSTAPLCWHATISPRDRDWRSLQTPEGQAS